MRETSGSEIGKRARARRSDREGLPAARVTDGTIGSQLRRGERRAIWTDRILSALGELGVGVGIGAVIVALPGDGVRDTIRPLLIVGASMVAVGAALLLTAALLGRLTHVSEIRAQMPQPDLPHTASARMLRRAGVTVRRPSGGDGLLTEPVLLVTGRRIYDQGESLRATVRPAAHNPSILRRVLSEKALWVAEVTDVHDQILLTVREGHETEPERLGRRSVRPQTFKALASDGSEIGMIVTRVGRHARHSIQVGAETIRSVGLVGKKKYRVRDLRDVEVGRITHQSESLIRRRSECNVIEIDDAMPEKLRHVMLAASEAICHLERRAAA